MLEKIIKYLTFVVMFLFPIIYLKGFLYPGIFPGTIFIFLMSELLLLLFVWYSLSRSKITIKKSYIILGLLIYLIFLFISGLLGSDFRQSFWSDFSRMNGLITWLHYFIFFLITLSIWSEEQHWEYFFRAILFSGIILAIISFLGVDGFKMNIFSFISKGGSLFGNTSYSGAYYLLVFFLSFIGYSLESSKKWKSVYILGLSIIFFNPDLFNFQIFQRGVSFSEIIKNLFLMTGLARTSSIVLWGGGIILLTLLFLHKFSTRKIVPVASLLFFLSVFFISSFSFFSIIKNKGLISKMYIEESGHARPIIWDIGLRAIKEHPFLGYGSGNFNYAYQENFDSRIINIEKGTEWFDNVHNFTLDKIINSGFIGWGIFIFLFYLIVLNSFRLYFKNNKFYFIIIPFTLLFHFLQTQTFFETNSTLFLVLFIIFFLSSFGKNQEVRLFSVFNKLWFKFIVLFIFLAAVYFFVYIPIKENLLVKRILETQNRSTRLGLYKNLYHLKVSPMSILDITSKTFMNNTIVNFQEIKNANITKNVADEYLIFLKAYKKYLSRYKNNYRYLIEYSNLINGGFIFGVNELKNGERLLNDALKISNTFPHSYWIFAINFYNQGDIQEALGYAKKAYNLDPTIKKSEELYEKIQFYSKIESSKRPPLYFLEL